MLEYKVETLDGLDESVQALYKADETEGGYVLEVNGAAPKEKVKEFRDNNIDLKNELSTMQEQFAAMNDSINKLSQNGADTEMADAIKGGAEAVNALIESRAATRAEAMKTDYQTQLDAASSTSNNYRTQLEDAKITAELTRLAAEKGVRATAVDDVLLRGKQVFKLDDEANVVAMKGEEVMYNKSNKPLTIAEYMDDLSLTAPHLFEASDGGGAANPVKTGSGAKGATFTYRGKEHKMGK